MSSGVPNTVEDFWRKVDITDDHLCWLWKGSTVKGYGQFRYNGKYSKAHRLAYEFTYGEIPEGLQVLHDPVICKNKSCVNPNHLRLGTATDNHRDPDFATIDMPKARYIRDLYSHGVKQAEIAKLTGLSRFNVWAITHNVSWREDADLYNASD